MSNADLRRRLWSQLWQPPRPHGEVQRDRAVGPLELFFDLVVVVLVAQAAHRLTDHLTWRGVAEFAVVFTVVWIAWLNGTLLHDLHGHEDVRSRNIFLGQILLLVPLGAYVPGAGNRHGEAFAVTAALAFPFLAFFWWRVSRVDAPEFARPTRFYVAITVAYAVGFAVSAPLPATARLILWAVMSLLYLVGVVAASELVPGEFGRTFIISDSLNERFGLLVLIVLGETVTGVVSGLTSDPTNGHKLAVGIVSVLVGFGAWWTYFDFVGHRPPRDTRVAEFTWVMAHLPVTAAIAGMGATMPRLVEDAADSRTATGPTWVLCGGAVALLLFTVVLMVTLQAWQSGGTLRRPLAVANVLASAAAIVIAAVQPSPLVLSILIVAVLSGPWTYAVSRKAALAAATDSEDSTDGDSGS